MSYERYIGTKKIKAMPMTKAEYCKKYEIEMPKIDKEGYEIIDLDDCVSWSPKESFENDYKKSGGMTFGHALELLKLGKRVARKGWNGKDMFLFLEKGEFLNRCIYNEITKNNKNMCQNFDMCSYSDTICMRTAQNTIVVGWLASQTDMLSEDWEIIN